MTETAKCSKCKTVKPIDAFYRNRSKKSGRHHECRVCAYERARARPYNSERARHYSRVSAYRTKYGLELAEVEAIFDAQDGLCAICNTRPDQLFIDHDHTTGEVRGALCRRCNLAIGQFGESPGLIARALAYLGY